MVFGPKSREGDRDRDEKRRKCWFAAADQPLFAMAGVWIDSEVPSVALLTCEANAALRSEGRDAMPVILPSDPRAHDLWLRGDWNQTKALLLPYSSSLMRQSGEARSDQ